MLHDDDLQEIRFAVVMTGGVSLAVWMGGAAHELNRLTRGEGIYGDLLRLTGCTAQVDVISGASAGGLNGALLAVATVHSTSLDGLRRLWLDVGAFEKLLRPPGESNPASLLQGDDYFLPQIDSALEGLARSESGLLPASDAPMHLSIVTTLLDGEPRGVRDSLGTVIDDVDHRGVLTFARRATRDDFATPGVVARLALASRCTASFPVAYEPVLCPVHAEGGDAAHPDMADHANFTSSRFVMDGGVLVNRPLGPALRAIVARPAHRQVRRVLAYVVPDPGDRPPEVPPTAESPVPDLTRVLLSSLVTLPRHQSIGRELDDITRQNDRVADQRRRRDLHLAHPGLTDLAPALYEGYRAARAARLADDLLDAVARGIAELEAVDPDETPEVPLKHPGELRPRLLERFGTLPPGTFPKPNVPVENWFTTPETVERAGAVVLDLLRRGLAVCRPTPGDPVQMKLRELRGRLHVHLKAVRALGRDMDADAEMRLARAFLDASSPDVVPEALRVAVGATEALRPLAARVAALLPQAAKAARDACEASPDAPGSVTLMGVAEAVLAAAPDPDKALRHLLALEVVQVALGGEPVVDQAVELVQMSADTANGFDDRGRAVEKLAGLQLAHFGAFYKRSWRANDWMWGRLDAVQRLAQVLFEPARLRQLGFTPDDLADQVQRLALGGPPGDAEPVLRARWAREREAIVEELAFLVGPEAGQPPAPLPEALPLCAGAVARRLQLEILRDELPVVAAAVRHHAEADGQPGSATAFASLLPEDAGPPDPYLALEAFAACRVGEERFAGEHGTNLLARTASQAVGVTTAALSGTHSGITGWPQKALAPLRGVGLALHLLVRNALSGSHTGAMLVMGALVAGGAIVGLALVVKVPGVVLLLGVTLLAAGLGLGLLRDRTRRAFFCLALPLLVALLPRIGGWIYDALEDDEDRVDEFWSLLARVEPGLVVAALVLGAFWLGRIGLAAPKSAEAS